MMKRISWRAIIGTLVITLLGAPTAADAQGADARWQSWLGCWSAAGGTQRVCVIPADGASAVDIVTTAGGAETREHIEASGERRVSERDGCTGWERAQWSADGVRVYLRSEYQCANGPMRNSSGLLAMSSKGQWLSLAAVTLGMNTGLRVLKYDAAISTPMTLAARASMAAIDSTAIIEASRQADPVVVEAWLGESGQMFTTNAKRLADLAAAKVPDRVLDMLVALSYPHAFAIKPSPTAAGLLLARDALGGTLEEFSAPLSFAACAPNTVGTLEDFGRLSLYGWDGCSMYYGYSPYAYARNINSPYGQWYTGAQPIVIIANPGATAEHGRVTKGGYVQGNNGSTGGSTTGSTIGAASTSSGDESGSPGSNGGSPTAAGAGSSSGGERTAHPR
jgi:hypothetical protein